MVPTGRKSKGTRVLVREAQKREGASNYYCAGFSFPKKKMFEVPFVSHRNNKKEKRKRGFHSE